MQDTAFDRLLLLLRNGRMREAMKISFLPAVRSKRGMLAFPVLPSRFLTRDFSEGPMSLVPTLPPHRRHYISGVMPEPESHIILAEELAEFRVGRTLIGQLHQKYSDRDLPGARLAKPILAFAEHYLADSERRAMDPIYRVTQEHAFDRLLVMLRSGQLNGSARMGLMSRAA